MCLKIDKQFLSKKEALEYFNEPLIAKKEFEVYKILEIYENKYLSIHYGFEYKQGTQYSESKFIKTIKPYPYANKYYIEISKGLHSYTEEKINQLKKTALYNYANLEIVKMWIPKGAKYFIGENGDIVSNELIWY